MNKHHYTLFALLLATVLTSFGQAKVIKNSVAHSAQQVELMVHQVDTFTKVPSPRTTAKDGISTRFTSLTDWTSGFFPGTLWYLYELTGEAKWKTSATKYTEAMEHIKYFTGNHDIGFMIFCSYGNALRLTGNQDYKDVIITAAGSLTKRYRKGAGVIQSWNTSKKWLCPVIIDNMMNLELMFEATQMSGDSSFWNIAVSHADNTMKNHYRQDISTWHVVDYDPKTGEVRGVNTHQGYADSSAWSRGQAWGLYGYTMTYRYTKDPKYLAHAEKIAHYVLGHKNLPKDMVPYWDYDAPKNPKDGRYPNLGSENPRDASAAAITASALYELSTHAPKGKQYKKAADKIVKSLASPEYLAQIGSNGNFILKHSTGSIPHGAEINAPLVYADYYFLEALKRKKDLESK